MNVASRIKRYIGWLLLTIVEYIGALILFPFVPLLVLIGDLRLLLFTISAKSKLLQRDYPAFYKVFLFLFYLQIAIGIPSLVYQFFGIEHLLTGVIVAGFLITFFAFQFPRMVPPYFDAYFLPAEDKSFKEEPKSNISVKPATQTLLFLRITNLGLATFKECVFSVVFPDDFKISEELRLYEGLDSRKNFVVRKQNRYIQFFPKDNYMTFPPCNHMVFPIWVTTPTKVGKYRLNTLLSSESTWGEAKNDYLWIKVTSE